MTAFLTTSAIGQEVENNQETPVSETVTAPVAYVYVSYRPGGSSANKIAAYSAAPNGSLTVVPGSPFSANVSSLAVNGKYLFGSTTNGINVSAYAMQPNGALHLSASTEVDHADPNACVSPGILHLDHNGSTLYRDADVGGLCDSQEYESFRINASTGSLSYLGNSGSRFLYDSPLTFSSSNVYAYGADCVDFEGGYIDTFAGLKRSSSGLLTYINAAAPTPATSNSSDFYCRSMTAADPAGHLAVSMQAINLSFESPDGAPRLGTYTMNSSGNLSTSSTFGNMPSSSVGYIFNLAMSPSGKLLAVAGAGGLQVFHFNGASPITHYTGLLTTTGIKQVFWDNANHLYGIGASTGKLYVFTVTPTSVSAAAGSPHAITSPDSLIVKPKT